jgi:glycosyltransferase involved in cell wall biosynthesis
MGSEGLTLVIPVYNEQEALASVLERTKRILAELGEGCEVILIDDGSEDGTQSMLEAFASDRCRILRHAENRGYGAALKTGVIAAAHDFIAITDADGTYPDHLIPELFRQICAQNLDMIVGARQGPNASIPIIRRPAKWLLSKVAQMLIGKRIPDLNSGLRIMKKAAIIRFANILPDGFSFTTTITLAMLANGYGVRYVDIDYSRRIGHSIQPISS